MNILWVLSGNNVLNDFYWFYLLAHYEFESIALCSHKAQRSGVFFIYCLFTGLGKIKNSGCVFLDGRTHFISVNPQEAPLWAGSVLQVACHALPWTAVCPANLASSSTWSWTGCGRGAPACPPVPGVTMAGAFHTSAPAQVSPYTSTSDGKTLK